MSESDNLYAKLLTSEPDITEEEKQKITDFAKKDRKMSVKSIKSLASAMSELSIPEAILAEQDDDSEEVSYYTDIQIVKKDYIDYPFCNMFFFCIFFNL